MRSQCWSFEEDEDAQRDANGGEDDFLISGKGWEDSSEKSDMNG